MDGMLGDVRFLFNSNMVVEVSSGDFKLASSLLLFLLLEGAKFVICLITFFCSSLKFVICNMFNNNSDFYLPRFIRYKVFGMLVFSVKIVVFSFNILQPIVYLVSLHRRVLLVFSFYFFFLLIWKSRN